MLNLIKSGLGMAGSVAGSALGGGGVWLLVGGLAISGAFATKWALAESALGKCRQGETAAVVEALDRFGEDQEAIGEIARRLRADMERTREAVSNAETTLSAASISASDCDLDPIASQLRGYFDTLNRSNAERE